ncbi:uncharacterized protein LOC127712684 [Mytilus californianus]|uniref:uncharacterized protein LOC127712684 n=1 Tax=Mytilus californianus TaxID=6549 RepID=UPI002245691B|nr:uncharacterized protein LOC127712684 [Mytilus californianus]
MKYQRLVHFTFFNLGAFIVLGTPDELVQLKPEVIGKPWRGVDIKSHRGNNNSTLQYLAVTNTMSGIQIWSMNTFIHNITSQSSATNGFTFYVNSNVTEVAISELNASNNGKTGIQIATEDIPSSEILFQILKCTVSQNNEYGIDIKANASVIISECDIEGNAESGIHVYQESGGRINVSTSKISRNVKYAIKGYFTEELVVDSCIISDHSFRRFGKYWFQRIPYVYLRKNDNSKFHIRILNSVFENNINDGIEIYFHYYSIGGLMLHIENNTFMDGNKTLFINYNSFYENMAYVKIIRNLFLNNSNSDGALVESKFEHVGDVKFENNKFEGNIAKNTLLITGNVRHSVGIISVQHNDMSGDWATESLININSYHEITVNYNDLHNLFPNVCVVSAPKFAESFEINATFNYWGLQSAMDILDLVCGFEKDMDRSYMHYIPFYTDNNFNQVVSLTQDEFDVHGAFGGDVTKNFTIPKLSSPIIISRALFVRPGTVLTLEAGAVIRFKENRGIYIQGVLKISTGSRRLTVMDSVNENVPWYGIVIKSTSDKYSTINYAQINNTMQGFTAFTNGFEMKHTHINNSRASCLSIKPENTDVTTHDFEGTSISNCKEIGISVFGNGEINVYNVNIQNASVGIKMDTYYGHLTVKSSNITNCSTAAYVRFGRTSQAAGNMTLDSCRISNCSNGVDYSMGNVWDINSVNIKYNIFTNITNNALSINFPSNDYNYRYIGHVDIGFNTFYNTCLIYLKTWNNANLSFHDNTIEYGNCEGLGKCYLDAYAKGNKEIKGRMFNISTNIFRDLVSDCIVSLVSSDDAGVFPGVFYYNKFLTTQATVGTVTLDSNCFNFSHNIFDNPKSPYDLYVKKTGTSSVNASNNWWGNADADIAYERIFDFHRDNSLLLVNITSILTDRNIDCSWVNNCSSNGECVSPNKCRCFSGYAGKMCLGYDCSGVHSCYGNGLCVGPNLCECNHGWSGQQCINALCSNVNNCSDHGFCIRPNICTCASSFTGENCSACIPSHWGTNCDPCPNCRNGECNLNTGTCDCIGAQWTGRLCDICSETFYGPDCLPLLTVLNVIPNQGLDRGGNDVHVWGHNFPQTDTYKCKFDTDVVNGVWVASNHVVCSAPKHADGTVSLEISSDGIEFSNNQVKYLYFATCPPNSCGRDVSPPRGQCLFGGCSCNLPWTGENCTIELLAPEIIEPPPQTINESVMYDYQLQLVRGSIPVTWSLIDHPGNMIIDERTGRLFWSNVIGRLSAYSVIVTATNIVGEHSIEWTINVPISYSVNLISLDPDGILSKPKQIDIVGEVAFSDLNAPRLVPIKLVIKSTLTGTERVLSPSNENYDPTSFITTYYPRPDDAGTFTVKAYHPGLEQSTGNTLTWVVLGMRCEPTFVSLKGYIDDSQAVFANVSTLKNVGGYPIGNISSKVYGIENVHVFKSEDKTKDTFFMAELLTDGVISFGFQIKDVKPMSETFYIVFSTIERTYARLQINIDLSIKKPLLFLNHLL